MTDRIMLTNEANAEIKNRQERIRDAERKIIECLYSFIDRMNDHCEVDTAARILDEFTEAVRPLIDQHCTEINENRYS